MASHFVRCTGDALCSTVQRLPQDVLNRARALPEKRRKRFLIARQLLAQLMQRIYGIHELPALTTGPNGRPRFIDTQLPDFSIAYAGNTIGVLLADEGGCAGLDMEIVRAHSRQTQDALTHGLSSGEKAWINAQQDFMEAVTQLWTLRQSILKLSDDAQHSTLQLHPAAGRLRSSVLPDVQAVCDAEPTLVWSCALSPSAERLNLWEIDAQQQWQPLHEVEMSKPKLGPRSLRLTSLVSVPSAAPYCAAYPTPPLMCVDKRDF